MAGLQKLHAQQLPMLTQYMLNDFAFNPAIAGTHDYYQVKNNVRIQWAGIEDAPRTYLLSVYGPHKTQPMGFGGYIYSDNAGKMSVNGLSLAYAYNIEAYQDIRVSMGLFAGITQYRFKISEIDYDPAMHYGMIDPVLSTAKDQAYIRPDARLGIYAYTSQYFFGYSANNLIPNKFVISEYDSIETDPGNRLKYHSYLMGGYKFMINRDFDLQPTVFFKHMGPAKPQVDINAKVIYQKMVWLGLSFRTSDAVCMILGYNYNDLVHIGYSYDYTFSELSQFSNGTHEILIGVRFNNIKKTRSRRKIR